MAEVERNRSGGKGNVSLDPTCLCELTEQEVYYMKDAARDAAREDSAYLNHFQEVYRREDE